MNDYDGCDGIEIKFETKEEEEIRKKKERNNKIMFTDQFTGLINNMIKLGLEDCFDNDAEDYTTQLDLIHKRLTWQYGYFEHQHIILLLEIALKLNRRVGFSREELIKRVNFLMDKRDGEVKI